MKQPEKLDVYIQADGPEYHAVLTRGLMPTLSEFCLDTEIHVLQIEAPFSESLVGRTEWDRYKELMRRRIGVYLEIVKQNVGKKILFLDCDVVAVQNFKSDMIEILGTCDMCFQSPGYNAGIWGVNCTLASIEFMENFYKSIDIPAENRTDGYPQFELRDMITLYCNEAKLKVVELGPEYGFITSNTKLYHAINGGNSAMSKMMVLSLAWQICFELKMGKPPAETLMQIAPYFRVGYKYYMETLPPDDPPQSICMHGFLSVEETYALKKRIESGAPHPPIDQQQLLHTTEEIIEVIKNIGYAVALVGDNKAHKYWPVATVGELNNYFTHDDFREMRHELDNCKK